MSQTTYMDESFIALPSLISSAISAFLTFPQPYSKATEVVVRVKYQGEQRPQAVLEVSGRVIEQLETVGSEILPIAAETKTFKTDLTAALPQNYFWPIAEGADTQYQDQRTPESYNSWSDYVKRRLVPLVQNYSRGVGLSAQLVTEE